VGDNLQKALESCNEKAEIDSIKEGLKLTLRSFEDSLETAGIVPLSPDGESFDPERHEAISVVEDDKKEPNTVIDVIERGFTIQNRILRPAKVVVTKKPDKK
jgi:molecular chaperone GrpE